VVEGVTLPLVAEELEPLPELDDELLPDGVEALPEFDAALLDEPEALPEFEPVLAN
jgi:hypothetical protein